MTTDASTKPLRRTELWLDAEKLLERHNQPMLAMLGGVILDLADECEGLRQFEQDARWAAELAYRIDRRINVPSELVEALDGVIAFFVALVAVNIYRAMQRRGVRLGRRIDRVEGLLLKDLATKRRRKLERRLERLRRRLGRVG
jgi:hypothetical protein